MSFIPADQSPPPRSLPALWRTTSGAPTTANNAVVTVLGLWLVAGVFIDGRAHFATPDLETFFTPWHAVLYSGATALFGSLAAMTWRRRGAPIGYRPALVAAPLFLLGGALDYAWHSAFGIETGLDALLSPTHLLLFASGILVLSTPWRSSRLPEQTARKVGALSAASLLLTWLLVAFALVYTSALTYPWAAVALTSIPEGAPGHELAEAPASLGLAAYLITTGLLVAPLVLLQRRGAVPRGTATVWTVGLTAASGSLVAFEQPWLPVAALVAGACTDIALRRFRHQSEAMAAVPFVVLPVLLWTGQLLGLHLQRHLAWPAELVAGVVAVSGALGGALSVGLARATRSSPAGGAMVVAAEAIGV